MTRHRILFVDDDPMILSGLRNGLRRQVSRWDMVFASSGETALAELASSPTAVIISDMRMPEMDGGTLLETVRRDYPQAIRILLTGYADPGAMATVSTAVHQLLRKPCGLPAIVLAVERACFLHDLLNNGNTQSVAAMCQQIADPPSLYADVARTLAYPELPAEDLARQLASDSEACRRVLALCTPAFGFSRIYATAADAVIELGPEVIGPLALASHVWGSLETTVDPRSLDEARLHGLAIARHIMPDDHASPSDAFTCCLLHDFGKLLFEQRDPIAYAKISTRALATGESIGAIEKDVFGTTHGELGAFLLARWGVALPIVDAVARQHVAPPPGTLADALARAHHCVRATAAGTS